MTNAPLPPSSRLGGAADVESGLELRLSGISADQSQVLARLRLQRQVEHLCKIPRLVAELLAGRHHAIEDDIAARLQRYAGLDPEVLRAVGGDRFPPAPLWDVSRVSR